MQHDSCLLTAQSLVYGAREKDYAHPRDDFAQTALIIEGILLPKLRPDCHITARDAGLIQIAVKLSRESRKHKTDNCIDSAGYFECVRRVEEDYP